MTLVPMTSTIPILYLSYLKKEENDGNMQKKSHEIRVALLKYMPKLTEFAKKMGYIPNKT